MTWDDLYARWLDSLDARRNAEAYERLCEVRKRVAQNDDADWHWLKIALADKEKKWFAAQVFRDQPVPKRLFQAMMLASIIDVNPSSNRLYLEPCLETFGTEKVAEALSRLEAMGSVPKERFEWARYWMQAKPEQSRSVR
ncbi:MAG: hypothetical protein U0744_03715 [Gemmataceae bacterium]